MLYSSPESYFEIDKGYDGFKADLWALGVSIFVILSKTLPFKLEENEETNHELAYAL